MFQVPSRSGQVRSGRVRCGPVPWSEGRIAYGHFLSTMFGPNSAYSAFEIHMSEQAEVRVDRDPTMLPPSHDVSARS